PLFLSPLVPHRGLLCCPTRRSSDLSSLCAPGINSRNSSIRLSFDNISCCTKYFVKGISFAPAANIVKRLLGFTEVTKSSKDPVLDRKSTRLNSSHVSISYAVFCSKK